MDNIKDVKTDALEEINKLTQYFQNIELMHNETARLQDTLTTETDKNRAEHVPRDSQNSYQFS